MTRKDIGSHGEALCCHGDEDRRSRVRQADFNGLDHLEVDCAQTTLTVYFLGRAPEWITAEHLRIDGGRRERGVRVTGAVIEPGGDEGLDDRLIVTVDRPGDFSSYRLCVTALDDTGRPTGKPPSDFDPRYACLCFSFKAGCPSDLDCAKEDPCEPEALDEPAIDYQAKDYASFRRLMLDRLALLMPEWKERHVPDIGITLVELLAYVGDRLSYEQDAVATEAYLATARQRISVRRHVRLVDYLLHEGCNARTWVVFEADDEQIELHARDFYVITPHPERAEAVLREQDLPLIDPPPFLGFQPKLPAGQDAITLRRVRNRIRLYLWEQTDCCLDKGGTRATLVDPGRIPDAPPPDPDPEACKPGESPLDVEAGVADGRWHLLKLKPGDVLVFEEVLGPHTGDPADADPAHRHAVWLTRATPSYDPLTRQLVYDVEWCIEDALPFPLCLSSVSEAPDCKPLRDVSVAWGNVLLVDHGLDVADDSWTVPTASSDSQCEDDCHAAEVRYRAGSFRPRLAKPDLTFCAPVAAYVDPAPPSCCAGCGPTSATSSLQQDVLKALPAIRLQSALSTDPDDTPAWQWTPKHDLLGSGPDDRHFVVEVDDFRVAWLRFGDGLSGRAPEAGEVFQAGYRTGSGPLGNVGAEALTQLVFRNAYPSGAGLRVRNPLPAVGGTAPEIVAEAKLRAPQAFKRRLERAVTPADYAAITLRDFAAHVQRAAASLRASGARVEVQVAIDARGTAEPEASLLRCIESHLQRYRRIGHDLRVVAARQVPLLLALHICVKDGYLRGHVKAALLKAFGAGGPVSRRGFFHPDALGVGEAVTLSRIVTVAQAVEGVSGVVVERLERLFEGPNGELADGLLPLGPLEVARLDNDPGNPENGQLLLALEGGR